MSLLSTIVPTTTDSLIKQSASRWLDAFAGGSINDISERQDFLAAGLGSMFAVAYYTEYIKASVTDDYNDRDVVFNHFSIGMMPNGKFHHVSDSDTVVKNTENFNMMRLIITEDTLPQNLYVVALGGGLDSYLLIEKTAADSYYVNTVNMVLGRPAALFNETTLMTLADLMSVAETLLWPIVSPTSPAPSAVAAANAALSTGSVAEGSVDFFFASVMTPTIPFGATIASLSPISEYVPPVVTNTPTPGDATSVSFTSAAPTPLTSTTVGDALDELAARPSADDSVAANTYTSTALNGASDLQAILASIDAALVNLGQ